MVCKGDKPQSNSASVSTNSSLPSDSSACSDIEENDWNPQRSCAHDENFLLSSLIKQYRERRINRDIVLETLRHDASILYDYQKAPPVFQMCPGHVTPDTSSNIKTQAIIDAAVIAMKRCDNIVLQRKFNFDTIFYL